MEAPTVKSEVLDLLDRLECLVAEKKPGPAFFLLYMLLYDKMVKGDFSTPAIFLRALSNFKLPPSVLVMVLSITSEFKEHLFDSRRLVIDKLKCRLLDRGDNSVIDVLLDGLL